MALNGRAHTVKQPGRLVLLQLDLFFSVFIGGKVLRQTHSNWHHYPNHQTIL